MREREEREEGKREEREERERGREGEREEEGAGRWRRNRCCNTHQPTIADTNLLGSLSDNLSRSVSMTTLVVVATGSLQQHGRQLYLLLLLRHRQYLQPVESLEVLQTFVTCAACSRDRPA